MNNSIHAYTSITSNYLPKARVLAESIRRVDPGIQFHLILSDNPPVGFNVSAEPFDSVIFAEELVGQNFAQWAFGHSLVELCTAVKGVALEHIFSNFAAEQVFYFDPDMVVFGRMRDLQDELSRRSVLLTPHLTAPETSEAGILDNELASLLHGVFNLGFVGVRNCVEGRRFSHWWTQRLLRFCHDDLARGIFTDQKWVNLAPCFFDDVAILRSPAYNVATWNLTNRIATGSLERGIFINGEPLGFYHFSGFDSGDQIVMLQRYGQASPVLHELRDWYVAECERQGQSALGTLKSKYDQFSNGLPVERSHRLLYRQRVDLQAAFPNPFLVAGTNCYKAWYDAHPAEHPPGSAVQIAPHTPIAEIMSELARQLTLMLNTGRGSNILKRFLLRVWIKSMRIAARILDHGVSP